MSQPIHDDQSLEMTAGIDFQAEHDEGGLKIKLGFKHWLWDSRWIAWIAVILLSLGIGGIGGLAHVIVEGRPLWVILIGILWLAVLLTGACLAAIIGIRSDYSAEIVLDDRQLAVRERLFKDHIETVLRRDEVVHVQVRPEGKEQCLEVITSEPKIITVLRMFQTPELSRVARLICGSWELRTAPSSLQWMEREARDIQTVQNRRMSKGARHPGVIGIVFVVGAGFLVHGLWLLAMGSASERWPLIEGTVLESRLDIAEGYGKIEYEYQVEGRPYTSNRIGYGWFPRDKPVQELIEAHPPGETISVYFNPGRHSQGVLIQGAPQIMIVLSMAMGTVILGIAAYLLLTRGAHKAEPVH